MSYELLALSVPPGAEIEEAGEALEVRLAGGHVHVDRSDAAAERRRAIADRVLAADPSLRPVAGEAGRLRLADGTTTTVEIDARFVVLRIEYARGGEHAAELFERVFRVVRALVDQPGWKVYDPQGACGVEAGDDGRDATLEIYLTVLDQLSPERARTPR